MYTNKSILLHTRCLTILELIQKNNNRLSAARADLRIYHAGKNTLMRLMNEESSFIKKIAKCDELNEWLIMRYQQAMIELNTETVKQLSKQQAA